MLVGYELNYVWTMVLVGSVSNCFDNDSSMICVELCLDNGAGRI